MKSHRWAWYVNVSTETALVYTTNSSFSEPSHRSIQFPQNLEPHTPSSALASGSWHRKPMRSDLVWHFLQLSVPRTPKCIKQPSQWHRAAHPPLFASRPLTRGYLWSPHRDRSHSGSTMACDRASCHQPNTYWPTTVMNKAASVSHLCIA